MKEELKIRICERLDAEVFHFRFDPYGWANFIICEKTGIFAIESDYGNFTHSWPSYKNRGSCNLKRFIIDTNKHYFTDKFSYGVSDARKVYIDRTIIEIKRKIIDYRKNDNLDKEEARKLYDECNELDDKVDSSIFIWTLPENLNKFLGNASIFPKIS